MDEFGAKAWLDHLTAWLAPFLAALPRAERRRRAPLSLRGLLLPGERKSVEPMAARVAPGHGQRLHHRVGSSALGDKEVARVFRHLATAAGLKLTPLPSGPSTRVGATRDMFAAGFELLEVMQAGAWKTPAMPARYGERPRARRGAARKLTTLPNRA